MVDVRELSFADWLKVFLKAVPAFVVVCAMVGIPIILALVFVLRDKDGHPIGVVEVPPSGTTEVRETTP